MAYSASHRALFAGGDGGGCGSLLFSPASLVATADDDVAVAEDDMPRCLLCCLDCCFFFFLFVCFLFCFGVRQVEAGVVRQG